MKYSFKDKVVVITGGSSGIGYAIACELLKLGAHLALIARCSNKLEEAAKRLRPLTGGETRIEIFPCDISVHQQVQQTVRQIHQQMGSIDVLINNAGIMRCGRFSEMQDKDFEESWNTNYLGALYMSRAVWPYLKQHKGKLSFVCSVAGYLGLIGYTAYSPTKFAMSGLADALRMEGKQEGVAVSIMYPADVNTSFLAYELQHALPETKALNRNIRVKEADEVAAIYVKGLQTGDYEIYCDLKSRFYRKLRVMLPSVFFREVDRIALIMRNNK